MAVSRTKGSRLAMRRGVKARLTSFRSRSCRGGIQDDHHRRHLEPWASRRSRVMPSDELYVCQSPSAACTSR